MHCFKFTTLPYFTVLAALGTKLVEILCFSTYINTIYAHIIHAKSYYYILIFQKEIVGVSVYICNASIFVILHDID